MNADLQRLIELQRLESIVHDAQRKVADEPARIQTLDGRLTAARQVVADAKEHLSRNQAARREIEKDVAVHQGRLSKYRDQLMNVKTNVEYQAMQKEIAFAQTEVKALEDKILEGMLENDELTAAVKKAESELAAITREVEAEKKALTAEVASLKEVIDRTNGERQQVIQGLDAKVLLTFQQVAGRRNGVAVAEAKDGICSVCHVRLRPQVFNTIRRNEEILQCDHCNRILYFVPAAAATAPADAAAAPAPTPTPTA